MHPSVKWGHLSVIEWDSQFLVTTFGPPKLASTAEKGAGDWKYICDFRAQRCTRPISVAWLPLEKGFFKCKWRPAFFGLFKWCLELFRPVISCKRKLKIDWKWSISGLRWFLALSMHRLGFLMGFIMLGQWVPVLMIHEIVYRHIKDWKWAFSEHKGVLGLSMIGTVIGFAHLVDLSVAQVCKVLSFSLKTFISL